MDKTIGAITLVRDSEKYIIPHLKMYKGIDKNMAIFIPEEIIGGSSGHSRADSSRKLIERYCPEVKIENIEKNRWGADLFNAALSLCDTDKIIMFHADVVMAPTEWQKLYKFIKETDYDVYKLDMRKCTINYYHDLEHGKRDCLDIEPIAVKKELRFSGIYDYIGTTCIIDWLEVHHFTGWKGIFMRQEWMNGIIPSESGVYIKDLEPFIPCPQEIRNLFHENSF